MTCTECQGLIDEKEGYATTRSSFEVTFSKRDSAGRLNNLPFKNEKTTKIICSNCLKNKK